MENSQWTVEEVNILNMLLNTLLSLSLSISLSRWYPPLPNTQKPRKNNIMPNSTVLITTILLSMVYSLPIYLSKNSYCPYYTCQFSPVYKNYSKKYYNDDGYWGISNNEPLSSDNRSTKEGLISIKDTLNIGNYRY